MNKTKHLFLKLLVLLVFGVGWSSGAWAALPAAQNWGNSTFTKLGDGNYKLYAPYYMSEPITVTTAGNLSVNYRYTGGSWAFPGVGFDLVDDNGVVKYSSYSPEAIGSNKNKTYTVDNVAPGSYNIRYMTSRYGNDGDFLGRTDPRGTITVSGTAATGFTPTITSWTHQGWSPVTSANPGLWEGLSIYNKYSAVANIHAYSSAATAMTGGQAVVVKFQKTSGSANLNVKGVELLDASNKIVAADYRDVTVNTTGKYTLNVPANGTYTVRTLVQTSTENNVNCAGTITYATPEKWTVKINDDYKVVYNGHNYGNNELVAIDIDTHDYRGITVNAPSTKAVWGPIVDNTNKTITFEISNPVTPQAGRWYKVQVLPTSGNLGANMVNAFNSRIKAEGVKGDYIYVQNAEQPSNRSDYKAIHCFMGMPENEAAAYVYVNYFTNNNILLQHINGRYINQEGKQQTTAQSSSDVLLTRENSGDYAGSYYWNKLQPFSLNDADIAHYFGRSSNSTNNFHTYFTEVNPEAKFDMYRVAVQYEGTSTAATSTAITYTGSVKNHGFSSVYHGGYFFFTKGASIKQADFNVPGGIKAITINQSAKTINVTIPLPTITHKRSLYYDKLEATAANKKPGYGHVGTTVAGDDGLVTRKDGIKEQKTSLFEIPVYLAPGTNRELYLPSDKLDYYQRWYNYNTDGLVDQQIMPALYSENFRMYQNGHVSGAINGNAAKGYTDNPRFYLPQTPLATEVIGGKTYHKDYPVAMDISRYKDYTRNGDNITEPTLSQRVIYRVMDAHKIADALKAATDAGDWLEKREIIFPTIKRGSSGNQNTGADIVPLNMDLNNYWAYNGSELVQLTNDNQFSVELDQSSTAQLSSYRRINGTALGGIKNGNFNRGHFVVFTYPQGNKAPDNSVAILNVYFTVGGTKYRLAQFTLRFLPGVEPQVISDVMGKEGNEYKNTRSPNYMKQTTVYGLPIAQMNFDNPRVDCSIPTSLVEHYNQWAGWNLQGQYEFPLDFSMTNYAHGYGNSSGTSRGEYAIKKTSETTGNNKYPYYPVKRYFDKLDGTSEYNENDDYLIYVDAADQAGKVMSIPVQGDLCAGTRLYISGWISSNAGSSNPASVILSIVGHDDDGNSKTLISYCPGMLSPWGYRNSDGSQVYTFNPNTNESTTNHESGNWALWQQIAFSFLLDATTIGTYSSYTMEVYNNCFDSSGGDYLLDNFQIFANPPKGEVDFTTPLCSDKVRHAKIHTDFEMLKDLQKPNDNNSKANFLTVSYCFLDSAIFNNYTEYGMKIADMFEMDDKGNHNLKTGYSIINENVKNIINHAFREALVGSRYDKVSGIPDHGFHTFTIPSDTALIKNYAFNDSKTEEVYKETDGSGVLRIVFKEDIVRGEMQMVPAKTVNGVVHPAYWPYMRPSHTYYLVFSPILVTQVDIDHSETATQIFSLHSKCSFFGKFTTKDPMHVILDNADIESDIPVQAVCHGETIELEFDMPARKAAKPIVDESYCTSDESLDGHDVPSTNGLKYRYQAVLNDTKVKETVLKLSYDWWIGGKLVKNNVVYKYSGTIGGYLNAKHPTYTYDHDLQDPSHTHTHAADYKKHGDPVDISQALQDFRFFYPEFGKEGNDNNWNTLTKHDYDNDSGYSLLMSEINALKELVDSGIIVLHRPKHKISLAMSDKDELTTAELSKMAEDELTVQILELVKKLNDADLVALESKVLDAVGAEGRKTLTLEEFGNLSYLELNALAKTVLTDKTPAEIDAMTETTLRSTVDEYLRSLSDANLQKLAKEEFPYLTNDERAYLIVRALNLLSQKTIKDSSLTEDEKLDSANTRPLLRTMMVDVLKTLSADELRRMWNDVKEKLTEEESSQLLGTNNIESMSQTELATLVEAALGKITDKVIRTLRTDKNFTLVPIMPSQQNYVDEPYIFCPEPRGVKISMREAAPKMYNGFGDKNYPTEMKNVPVRAGLQQLNAVSYNLDNLPSVYKTLRIPLRGLEKALDEGKYLTYYGKTLGGDSIKTVFLADTNDSVYEDKFGFETKEEKEEYKLKAFGKITNMQAEFGKSDNFMELVFNKDYPMHEGHTYRIGVRFVEIDDNKERDIACDGIFYFDLKVVPEFQVWTGKNKGADNQPVNITEWTNDRNWARADSTELLADGAVTGQVISAATKFAVGDTGKESYYLNNADNFGVHSNPDSLGFMPMYFTNVLFNKSGVKAPILAAAVEENGFLKVSTAQSNRSGFENHIMIDHAVDPEFAFIQAEGSPAKDQKVYPIVYDMNVAPSNTSADRYAAYNGNYTCEVFGTNIAKGVTFAPQTQLVNAHYLNYYKAWVEYELDVNRWYTLGSPLQNTFAGEWYAPTDGAKQKSPYFYDIKYVQRSNNGTTGYNDRFRPAIYQRSWDSKGNVPVYIKTGGSDNHGAASWGTGENSKEPAYVAADWSYVFNNVTKQYSNGGFSVKVNTDLMTNKPSDEKAIIRMPKADVKYTYYDSDGTTGQHNDSTIAVNDTRGHLWSDVLKTNAQIVQHINNSTDKNNFFLVNNPFIANMDMKTFFTVNTQFDKKYWIMTAQGQIVKVQVDETTWVKADGSNNFASAYAKVGPLQGFFVKTTDANVNSTTVTFTAAMQEASAETAKELKSRPEAASSIQTLSLTAQRGDFTSTAVVAISNGASKEYVSSEDCETFIDSDMADLPTIYTVASGQAMTVNTLSAIDMIAVGILGKEGEEVDVTISGNCEGLLLFDSKENTYTEIHEGTELVMSCGVSGRYFITASTTALDQITDNDRIRKGVWSVNGMYCGETTDGIAPGLYIVDGVKMNIR